MRFLFCLKTGLFIVLLASISACTRTTLHASPEPIKTILTSTKVGSLNTPGTIQIKSTTPIPTPESPVTPRLIAYYYSLDPANQITSISYDKLSDLIYAFITVSTNGECTSINPAIDKINFKTIKQLKQTHPDLHVLISVGGYSHSTNFSDVASIKSLRHALAVSCVQYMVQNGFDGIDIDWETPVNGGLSGNKHRPEDKQNFSALLIELRTQLDQQTHKDQKTYLLSTALPAGPSQINNFEIAEIQSYVDWMTVMAYAFYTNSSTFTNFNAPLFPSSTDPSPEKTKRLLYNASAAIKAYIDAGVAAGKISLGVPFYGRGWQEVPSENDGLYQKNSGPFIDNTIPKGTWTRDGEITYKNLKKYYIGKWARFWQVEAQVPWLYNSDFHVMITYDDPQSLGDKADYAKAKKLGGISIWQINDDDDLNTLTETLYTHLQP